MVEWSPQQREALRLVGGWRSAGRNQCFVLGGYAGTGKTTLARHLAGEAGGRTYFASFTGKAAHVMRKTGVEASTIHKLIYLPREKCDLRLRQLENELGKLRRSKEEPDAKKARELEEAVRAERENLSRPDFLLNHDSPLCGARLVVVDEYSMVDQRIGADLMSFGCPVLALGDPGQLPPVRGSCYFDEPDYVLTEVHRQAAGNPVVGLATEVREGRLLRPGKYGSSSVLRRSELSGGDLDDMMLAVDQVLVGTNRTRRTVNQMVRKMLGKKGPLPEVGDKLICLRNDHEVGLLNGQTWVVEKVAAGRFLRLTLRGEDDEVLHCLAHRDHFESETVSLSPRTRKLAQELDYGYAVTVHKAQGSQWESVLLFDEWCWDGRTQWLYTGITRASEDVTVIVN